MGTKMDRSEISIRGFISVARELVSRPEIQEVIVNLASARITVVVDPNFLERKLEGLLDEAKSYYGKLGSLRELREYEFEDGVFELALSIEKGKLKYLEDLAEGRGDYITGLEERKREGALIVRILLRSSSIEKAIEPIGEELSKLKFIVEYAGAELDASRAAIFTPSIAIPSKVSNQTSLIIPLKYRAYIDLCFKLNNEA